MSKRTNVRGLRDERDASGHLVGESVEIDDPDDPADPQNPRKARRKVRVFQRVGLLRRLHDAGRINEEQRKAGERFEAQFELAGLGPRYGSIKPDAIIVDGGRQWCEPMGGSPVARDEIEAALEYVGEFGAHFLVWIVGMGVTIKTFVDDNRAGVPIHNEAVQFPLIGALHALAAFYRRERRHAEGR